MVSIIPLDSIFNVVALKVFFSWVLGFIWFFMKEYWWIFSILIAGGILANYFSRKNFYGNRKTYIDESGYKRFSDSDMLVSRWVAEKKLNRKLDEEEVVHHKNGNKLDNRLNNLEIFANQDEHGKEHGFNNFDDEI